MRSAAVEVRTTNPWFNNQCAINYTTAIFILPHHCFLYFGEERCWLLAPPFTHILQDFARVSSQHPTTFVYSSSRLFIISLLGHHFWSPPEPGFEPRTYHLQTGVLPITLMRYFFRFFIIFFILVRQISTPYLITFRIELTGLEFSVNPLDFCCLFQSLIHHPFVPVPTSAEAWIRTTDLWFTKQYVTNYITAVFLLRLHWSLYFLEKLVPCIILFTNLLDWARVPVTEIFLFNL